MSLTFFNPFSAPSTPLLSSSSLTNCAVIGFDDNKTSLPVPNKLFNVSLTPVVSSAFFSPFSKLFLTSYNSESGIDVTP